MAIGPKVAGIGTRGLARASQQQEEQSPYDVWTQTGEGISERTRAILDDPAGAMKEQWNGRAAQLAALGNGHQGNVSADAASDAMLAAGEGVGDAFSKISEADGALQTVGAAFGTLTALEQMLSVPFSVIPFPALPALRITDIDIGIPHAHSHPPNFIPPAPPVPFPHTGPIIPIPFVSGASKVLINNMPAARCGDMGLAIWCGGYFPMFEIFFGSSSVWVEGARAARMGVDMSKHCIFSTPKPSDLPLGPPIGTTITSSPNVIIGGVPLPSMTSFAVGKAFGAVFKGLGKLKGMMKAADDVVEEAGEAAGRVADDLPLSFSRRGVAQTKPRPQALREVMEEIRREGITVRADDEAQEILDQGAIALGRDPAQVAGAARGGDEIFVRPDHLDNPRTLREELIHCQQYRDGKIPDEYSAAAEVAVEKEARELMIENADEWGITAEEVAEMEDQIVAMDMFGEYM